MIDEQLQALLEAVDGTIVQDFQRPPEAVVKLEHGTLDYPNQNQNPKNPLKTPLLPTPLDEKNELYFGTGDNDGIFSTTQPSGAHHMVIIKDMKGEFDGSMIYCQEPHRKPKKGAKRKKSGIPSDIDQEKSIRRAKSKVRESAMMMDADHLLTLTTKRAIYELSEYHNLMGMFLRILKKQLKGKKKFQYIAVYEKHESQLTSAEKLGSYHTHIATSGFVPYKILWKSWRAANAAIYGENASEECRVHGQRNVNRLVNKKQKKSLIAKYLSKYIAKAFQDSYQFNKKKYWRSNNIEQPIKHIFYIATGSGIQYQFIKMFEHFTGQSITRQYDSRDKEDGPSPPFLWLTTSR